MKNFLAFLSLLAPASGALTVDFESPGGLATYFAVGGDSTGISEVVDGVGFNGSAGVSNQSATRVHGFVVPISFSGTTSTWQTSILWNPRDSNSVQFTLGVVDSPDLFFSGGTIPASVQDTADVNDVLGSLYTTFASSGINFYSGQPGIVPVEEAITLQSLPQNTWYRVAMDVQFNGGASYTTTASISSVDGAGNATSELVAASATFDNAALAAGQVYPFFSVQDTLGNLDNFYNSAVVPEPGAVSLLGLAGATLLVRRRRSNG